MDPRASRSPDKSHRTHPPPTAYEHPPPHAHAHVAPPPATMPIGEFDDEMYKRCLETGRYLAIKPIVHELEDENNLIAYKIKVITPRIRQLEDELKAKREAIEQKRRERPPQNKLWKAPKSSPGSGPSAAALVAEATPEIRMDPGEWAALEKVHAGTHGYYSSDEDGVAPQRSAGDGKNDSGNSKNGNGKRKSGGPVDDVHAMDVDMDSMRDSREGTRRSEEDDDEEIDDY